MIIFDQFPLPPSENSAYPSATTKTGKSYRFKSQSLKAFENAAEDWRLRNLQLWRQARNKIQTETVTGFDQFKVDCYLGFAIDRLIWKRKKTRRKLDAQNYIKALFDQLGKLFGVDDCHLHPGKVEPVIAQREHCLIIVTKGRLRYLNDVKKEIREEKENEEKRNPKTLEEVRS